MQHNISRDTSQEYFNIQPWRRKISKVNPVSPGSERQPAHRTTSASLHLFPPQGPEDHLQAYQYQPKIWNIHIDLVVNHEYNYFSKTNPTYYDFYQETEPNYNNSIFTTQRLHLRKPSLQEYPNITQSSNTFQHLDIQTSQSGVIYTISKSVPSVEHSTHIIIISWRLTIMCARRSQHARRISHRLFRARMPG